MALYKHNTPGHKKYRSTLRKHQTQAERLLWTKLRSNPWDIRFRRQFSIGDYIVDFYCHAYKLVIEIDGITHDDVRTQDKDKVKQHFLKTNGYTVLRYTDNQVLQQIDAVVQDIASNVTT